MPTPSNIVSSDYVARPLSSADSGAVLADIHLHSLDYQEKAISEFREILNMEPNNGAACRGLGYAYLQKQDFTQAAEYFKRAAQADSKDPRVHYYSALLMSREGSFAENSDLPEMIHQLDIAIALDPSFADSYMLLAFAQMRAGDPAKGLVSMQKAVSLSPRNENYQFNLAQMYLGNRQPDPAIAILQGLSRSGNPEVAQRAGGSLAQAQQFKAAMQEQRSVDRGFSSESDSEKPVNGSARIYRDPTPEEGIHVIANQTPPSFLKGTIASVDCSSPPAAILSVISGGKTWKMRVSDNKHVLLIGADAFSCSWSKLKVALNYRETGEGMGKVFSIEVQ
jgi:cytochrome c-type biogenesis protein CcmH/NrfG